jgi:hypothetical protein
MVTSKFRSGFQHSVQALNLAIDIKSSLDCDEEQIGIAKDMILPDALLPAALETLKLQVNQVSDKLERSLDAVIDGLLTMFFFTCPVWAVLTLRPPISCCSTQGRVGGGTNALEAVGQVIVWRLADKGTPVVIASTTWESSSMVTTQVPVIRYTNTCLEHLLQLGS